MGSTILVSCSKADLNLISEYEKSTAEEYEMTEKNISMQLILKGKNTKIKIWCMCSKKATPLKTNLRRTNTPFPCQVMFLKAKNHLNES